MKKGPVIERTFLAMCNGWLVCNASFFLIAALLEFVNNGTILLAFFLLIYSLIVSALAIFLAWLFVVIPIDACLPDNSSLREKSRASGVGSLVGFMTVFLPLVLTTDSTNYFHQALYSLFGAVTGLAAGYYLGKHYPPVETQYSNTEPGENFTKN